MLLNWFDASEAMQFGETLAQFHNERISLDSAQGKKDEKKRQASLDKLFRQMSRFRAEHKLNVYQNAKMGNAFKWNLKDAGYDSDYVDQLTKQLMFIR